MQNERTQIRNKLTYHLDYVAERRNGRWYIGLSSGIKKSSDARSKWQGPFDSIRVAALGIGRLIADELTTRHTVDVHRYKLQERDELYGFKSNARVNAHRGRCRQRPKVQ